MFRYRQKLKIYQGTPKSKTCPFCETEGRGSIVKETPNAYVIENIFGYDLWDSQRVIEHLMVIPKRHVKSLKDLTPEERMEIMDIMAGYESQNYNIYARSAESLQRSVPSHQHTHIIKTAGKEAHGSLYLRKPYFLFKF